MNHSPSSSLSLKHAIEGFIFFKEAEGLAKRTIDSYIDVLDRWYEKTGERNVETISSSEMVKYMTWLKHEYKPKRYNGNEKPISPKTLRNHWVVFSGFFRWVSRELHIENIMQDVPAPKFKKKPIVPFERDEVEAILKACSYSREVAPIDRRKFSMKRATAKRDESIIMMLLDTGMRAQELCSLKIGALDIKSGQIIIEHGSSGGAKGGKGRVVFMGKQTRKTVWRYLNSREDGKDKDAPVFLGIRGREMNPNSLRHLIVSLGTRAGVSGATTHRFRHTMAITYLRSGGDIFTLQVLLGHSSLDMVRHYANVASIDVKQAHRKASPVDNWRL